MIRAVIDDVVSSFSPKTTSHKTGWARMQRCLVADTLEADERGWCGQGNVCKLLGPKDEARVHEAKTWLVSHAMEFTGKGYNLFGGWREPTAARVRRIAEFSGELSSLERPMPDLHELLHRAAAKSSCDLSADEWDAIKAKCHYARTITHLDLLRWAGVGDPDVVLGDSHSVAHYMRGRLVLRNDGLTLHGLLKRGIYETLRQSADYNFREITICAGNIDIRHHLMRQPNAAGAVSELVDELHRQLTNLRAIGVVDRFAVVAPLPIEYEARRIPGTGCYKGTPFFGSFAERASLAEMMRVSLLRTFRSENVFEWPREWYGLDPEQYAIRHMERPSSVHLSPEWHRWDYATNAPNGAYA